MAQIMYKSIEELPAMLNVKDIQLFFGIGKRQAYELVRTDGFPTLKIGTTIKIPKHLLKDWIKVNTEKGAYSNG